MRAEDPLIAIEWLSRLSDLVWGPFVLIPLLSVTGLYLTIRLRGIQLTQLLPSLKLAFVVRHDPEGDGDISHFQALMTALAATVGTGNIIGVATAIHLGGPGALFWMWMTAIVGMATKYSEALLSVHFRIKDARGDQAGGPMYYLSRGVSPRPLGLALGAAFAFFATIASFGIGNMTQSNSVALALENAFSIEPWISGLVMTALAALVLLGGIRSIGRFTSFFVPAMIGLYVVMGLAVLAFNLGAVPHALGLVLDGAFSGTAAAGGFAGAAMREAIRFGVARGIFSNESGLGSAGIAAAAAQTREPVRQALVSMTQTFIDTIIVCTVTGLAILVTGAWETGLNGAELTQRAFQNALPGSVGPPLVAIALAMFAFSTILGWCYYGERSIEYLLGAWAVVPYRIVFVAMVFVGAVKSLDFVWLLSDVMNGLMALPNLVGLLLLSGTIVALTRDYLARSR